MEDDLSNRQERKKRKERNRAWAMGYGLNPKLPKRRADEPFRGYKQASLAYDGERYAFLATMVTSLPYGVEADAECNRGGTTHAAPCRTCSCGFYAYKERPHNLAWRPSGLSVALDVDLYGRVIVYTQGYRAAHQRVVRAELYVPRGCGTVLERQMMEVTTFGDASRRFVPGMPTRLCGREATQFVGLQPLCSRCADGYGTPIEELLHTLRRDLPTEWSMRQVPYDDHYEVW